MRLKPDPLGQPRNPFQVYLLLLASISAIGQLAGVSTTQSIESQLPSLAQTVWSTMLLLGSTAALAGMFWPGDNRTGLLLKRYGFVGLTLASIIYGSVLLYGIGFGGSLVALTVYGFAAVCGERAWTVDRYIRRNIRREGRRNA